jgi:hypothetical protein
MTSPSSSQNADEGSPISHPLFYRSPLCSGFSPGSGKSKSASLISGSGSRCPSCFSRPTSIGLIVFRPARPFLRVLIDSDFRHDSGSSSLYHWSFVREIAINEVNLSHRGFMKSFLSVLLMFSCFSLFAFATPQPKLLRVKAKHRHATRHHAHKATKHHAPKHHHHAVQA